MQEKNILKIVLMKTSILRIEYNGLVAIKPYR